MTRLFLTVDGIETTQNASDFAIVQYLVETPVVLSAPSVETIMVALVTSTATVDIVYPVDKQLSSDPLSGSFYVSCYNTDGSMYDTSDMDITTITAATF